MKASEYVDIGHYLRDSRESLNLSIEQAAAALHIRAKYLRSLESSELSDLPGKAYIRGYIRKYADFLSLDSDEVLEAYDMLSMHKGTEFFIPEPTHKQNMPSPKSVWVAIFGLALVYGYWYFAVHDRTRIQENIPDVPQRFMQMLDKTPAPAMDSAWKQCLETGGIDCFIERRESAIPAYMVELYDIDILNFLPDDNAPQEP